MAQNVGWGLDNPHPLSLMKTKLVWEGKYDEYGKRDRIWQASLPEGAKIKGAECKRLWEIIEGKKSWKSIMAFSFE